jgi:hypothetical protein
MARPQKTSLELIASQARAGRIKARQAQERAKAAPEPTPEPTNSVNPLALAALVEALEKEGDTFHSRLRPTETISREYGDVIFNFRTNHILSWLRDCATQIATGKVASGRFTKRCCKRFLSDLTAGASRGYYMDPCAVDNLKLWIGTFTGEVKPLDFLGTLSAAQIIGWKRSDGSRRFATRWTETSTYEDVLKFGFALGGK